MTTSKKSGQKKSKKKSGVASDDDTDDEKTNMVDEVGDEDEEEAEGVDQTTEDEKQQSGGLEINRHNPDDATLTFASTSSEERDKYVQRTFLVRQRTNSLATRPKKKKHDKEDVEIFVSDEMLNAYGTKKATLVAPFFLYLLND